MVALRGGADSYERDTPCGVVNSTVWSRRDIYRGTSLIRKLPPPKDRHVALGIGLVYHPGRKLFLMCEVPL